MANICSTYIRIYPKARLYFGLEQFQLHKICAELLSGNHGYSYNTPFYSCFGEFGQYLELAYGEKHAPGTIHNYFANNKSAIDAIFYRFYNDGDDHDYINVLSNNTALSALLKGNITETRKCRYGFDMVKFKTDTKIDHPLVSELSPNWYQAKLSGSYISANDYCFLLHRTNFSAFKIDDHEYALFAPERGLICDKPSLIEQIDESADIVEYYYREKLVTYAISDGAYKSQYPSDRNRFIGLEHEYEKFYFPFDSWYNCVDELYLKYCNEINPIKSAG